MTINPGVAETMSSYSETKYTETEINSSTTDCGENPSLRSETPGASPVMARIPETELERLKNEVSVERLVEASGIELKHSGKDWLGRCPFHAGRDGEPGGDAGQEPVALLRLRRGRRPD